MLKEGINVADRKHPVLSRYKNHDREGHFCTSKNAFLNLAR